MLECWPRYEEATSYKPCFVSEEASLSLHSDDDSGSGDQDCEVLQAPAAEDQHHHLQQDTSCHNVWNLIYQLRIHAFRSSVHYIVKTLG